MKIFGSLLLLVCVGSLVEGTFDNLTSHEVQAFRSVVARSVSELVASRLRQHHGPVRDTPGAKATMFPPIADPAIMDPLNICGLNIEVPIPGAEFTIEGDINVLNPVVTGMSNFVNDLEVAFIALTGALTIDLELSIPEVEILSPYMAEVMFSDKYGSMDLFGEGDLPFGATDVFLTLHAKGKAPLAGQFMSLDELNVDLGFKNLMFDPSGLTSQGEPVNFTSLANNIQTLFDTLWTDESKVQVNEMIRCVLDDLISECNIGLITSGGLECLKDELKQECFGPAKNSFTEKIVFQTPMCEWLATVTTEETEAPVTEPEGTKAPVTDPEDTEAPVTKPPTTGTASSVNVSSAFITVIAVCITKYFM